MGFFYRTIRMVDNGIKPVYVFDGKPPTMKGGELAKRAERREEAQKQLEKAEEAGKITRQDVSPVIIDFFFIFILCSLSCLHEYYTKSFLCPYLFS